MKSTDRIIQRLIALARAMCLIPLVPCIVSAQEISGAAAMEFAQKSLSNYVENVLTEKNIVHFGFKSLQEARSARVGDPLRVMMIGLKNLKEYRKGAKAASMFTNTKVLWFPVLISGDTRSKLEMTEKDGALVTGEFGMTKTAEKISSVRKILPRLLETGNVREVKTTTLVKIPSLAAEFLYIESAQGEFFIPAMVNPERLNFEDGKLYSADEALAHLHEVAKDIDPNKVM